MNIAVTVNDIRSGVPFDSVRAKGELADTVSGPIKFRTIKSPDYSAQISFRKL